MITAYTIIDATGFRRIGGCLSEGDLQGILNGYAEPAQSVVIQQIPRNQYDDWRDQQTQMPA